ncbi:hypothetical protein GCM10023321_41410 [Pseudonocardia eucalypti]|uniref:Recombinase XerD n=1 Tax=Pseudonocardia eucalypti TaxID=648755 RepID=A0ABP9QCW2_9PSEU|nr:ribosomal protein S14 [Pseudonocardia eucalypti]
MTDPDPPESPARRPRGRPRTSGHYRCDRCGRLAGKLRTRWPEGGICGTCFHHAVRTFGTCRCGHHGMLPGLDGLNNGHPACRRCAGITTDLDCQRCGVEAEHYRRGLCARCCLRDDLTALLPPAAPPAPPISRLINVLCEVERPESIHTWKRNPQVQALLRGLGDGTLALTHEAFDQADGAQMVGHLRDLLVHHGLLPHRDLTRFENWLHRRLAETHPAWVRRMLEQYATWHHIREIRGRISRGQDAGGRVHTAKQEITEIGRLLSWLDKKNTTLATCTQRQIDTWLAAGPSTRSAVRPFLHWAHRQRLAPKLTIVRRHAHSTPMITHETRMRWLALCLREEPATRAYRVAATLLLLYAQPLVRIAALRCDQILTTPTGPAILLGNEPAALVAPFDQLLLEHLKHRPNTQTGNTNSPWLFPSTHAGRHLHPNTLMSRLRTLGIDLRGARNAALKQLVQQAPPPIVASQLGYDPAVTQRHAEQAAQPDAHYAALIRG